MTENEQTKRDKKIKSQYDFRAGVTMRQLSKKYDISIGRIQQIINPKPLVVKVPRIKLDPQLSKLRRILRDRFKQALKGQYKHSRILEVIGCSIEEYKKYLEAQFKKGMTWSNHGRWEIDHIKILNHYGKRRIDERVQKWYKKLCTFVILRCLTYLARGIKILTDSSNGFSVSAGKYDSNESVVCTSRRKWWDYKFYVYQNAHHHFRLFMRQDYSLESLVLPVASSGG